MMTFVDYVIRWICSCILIICINLCTRDDLSICGIRLAKYRFDIAKMELSCTARIGSTHNIVWNLQERRIKTPTLPGLSLTYTTLLDFVKNGNFQLNYMNQFVECSIRSEQYKSGVVYLRGKRFLNGELSVFYKITDSMLEVTNQPGSESGIEFDVVQWNLWQDGYLKLQYDFGKQQLSLDSDTAGGTLRVNGSTIMGDIFIKTGLIQGSCNVSWTGSDITVDCELERAKLPELISNLLSFISAISDSNSPKRTITINGAIKQCELFNESLRMVSGKMIFKEGQLFMFDGLGFTNKCKEVKMSSDRYSPISIICDDAEGMFRLVSPLPLLVGGKVVASIDVNHPLKMWNCSIMDVEVPYLKSAQLKHFLSPMQLLKRAFSNPQVMPLIRLKGYLVEKVIRVLTVNASNNYYKVTLKGQGDLITRNLDIEGVISVVNLVNTIGELSSVEFLKDIIRINISGPMNKPSFQIQMTPISVFTTLMQVVLF